MVDIFAKEGIKVSPRQPKNDTSVFATIPSISMDELNEVKAPVGGTSEPVRLKAQPVDIFQAEGMTPPSITERNTNAMTSGVELDNPKTEDEKIVADNVKQSLSDIEVLAQSRFTPEQIADFKNNPITFTKAGKFLNAQNTLPGGGVYQAFDLVVAKKAVDKLKSGVEMKDLSVTEEDTLNKMVDTYIEQQMRGYTIGGRIAYGLAQMPAFAVEFIASGGVGKLAQVGVTKTVEKAATKLMVASTAKTIAAKTVGVTANVVARTAVMPTLYAPKYAERRFNDSVAITDKGDLLFKQSEESPAKSALMAFGYSSTEVASEMAGGAIGKYVLDPVRGVLKTPLTAAVSKLPVNVRTALYEAYKKINPNAQVSKVFTAAGWNGMLEEMGEEQVNRVMQSTLGLVGNDKQAASDGKNFDFGDFIDQAIPSGDQLLVEAGIIAIAGGVKTSADLTFNLLKNKGVAPTEARQMADNMSANEQEQFVKDNLVAPVSGYVPNVEAERPQVPEGMTEFVELARSAENVEQFIEQVRGIKNVSTDVQEFFGNKYRADGIDIRRASELFINDVENGAYDAPATPTVEQITDGTPRLEIDEQAAIADGAPPSPINFEGEISQGQIASVEQSEPPPIIDDESVMNKLYREWVNELDPIQKLPEMARARGQHVGVMDDTKLLSSTYSGVLGMIRQNLQVNTFTKDADGNNVVTGKSLKATLDDFDNMFIPVEAKRKQREQDFSDYLIAQRYLEDLDPREGVEVTEAQKLKSVEDLQRLAAKYGENFQFFETFAQEVYDFQRRILKNLVDSGVMAQETYDDILAKNPNYVPFQRVMEDESFAGNVSTNGVFTNANANRIIKRITGSDKEVKNVFHSIIKNTAKIIDMSARNQVAQSIANLETSLPEYVQRVEAPMIKKGTAKVKISYDPKLRSKLEATIAAFGEEFKHEKKVDGVKGFKNVLGSYSEQEKTVRLKIGSNEGTLAHEVGHMLDYRLGLQKKMLSDPEIKAELQQLAQDRLTGQFTLKDGQSGVQFEEVNKQIASDKYLKYIKNDPEVLANFFDAYVNSNEQLDKVAPKAKAAFEKIIDENDKLAFLRDIRPSTSRAQETVEQDVWGQAEYAPPNTITVRRDGKKEYYRVAKPMLEAIESMSPAKLNVLDAIFRVPASILRAGATLVPEFWVRNVLRDQQGALLQSGVKYRPTDFARGLWAVVMKNDLYNQWERSGGSFNSFMELDDKGLEKAYQELFRPDGKMMRYLKNPLNIAADISGALEQATRVGVFSRAGLEGQSDIEAALTSRDATLDFSRRGSIGKNINRYIPFFNAGVQGINKMIRTFKTNPKAVTFWGVATITIPSVLITGYYLYGAPDDERKEYLEIPEWQRDMFWIVKVGDEWKRYPKPFTLGYIFGSSVERVMMWGYAKGDPSVKSSWEDLALGLGGSMSPVYDPSALIPPLAKVAIEDVTNYNFFTGRRIYPEWMEKLDPEFQSNKYTSETAKLLGKQLDISPAKIDNTLRGTLAGSSDYLTGAGDAIIKQVREWNGEDVPEEPKTASDIAIAKAFAVRRPAGYRSQSAKYFFENYDEAQRKKGSAEKLDGEEKAAYKKKNAKILGQYGQLSGSFKAMKDLQKQVDAIYDNPNMDSEEKVKRINLLEDRITEIARQSNTHYNQATREEK